mmetsp:Transcript_43570/g.85311  ORF Transcript_43570/g.85311 Transcript_43570/m.85311 type:complete len:263 (-) Transcript_43570:619-1407(-)
MMLRRSTKNRRVYTTRALNAPICSTMTPPAPLVQPQRTRKMATSIHPTKLTCLLQRTKSAKTTCTNQTFICTKTRNFIHRRRLHDRHILPLQLSSLLASKALQIPKPLTALEHILLIIHPITKKIFNRTSMTNIITKTQPIKHNQVISQKNTTTTTIACPSTWTFLMSPKGVKRNGVANYRCLLRRPWTQTSRNFPGLRNLLLVLDISASTCHQSVTQHKPQMRMGQCGMTTLRATPSKTQATTAPYRTNAVHKTHYLVLTT